MRLKRGGAVGERALAFTSPCPESVGDSRGMRRERGAVGKRDDSRGVWLKRGGRDACVSYNYIGWSGETADAGDLKSLGAIRTGSNPVFSMRSLSSAVGFFFVSPIRSW